MNEPSICVLFLCRDNAARSIMAEAVLNRMGSGRVRGVSAGSAPAAQVHRDTIRTLSAAGYPAHELSPKSWDIFAQADQPPAHLVITVCDDVAEETCPPWPGRPARAHWEIANPIAESQDHDGDPHAFRQTLRTLEDRIARFLERIERQNALTDLERAARF